MYKKYGNQRKLYPEIKTFFEYVVFLLSRYISWFGYWFLVVVQLWFRKQDLCCHINPTKKSTNRAKKKVVLFLGIGQVKNLLSPSWLHKSNVYDNIYFLFQENTQKQKNFHLQIYSDAFMFFSLWKIKDRALSF